MSELALSIPDALIERIVELVLTRLADRGESRRTPYLSVAEAAERLRAKPQRVYDLLSSGRLTRFKDGSRVLVSRDELDAYLAGAGRSRVAPALPHAAQSRISKGIAA